VTPDTFVFTAFSPVRRFDRASIFVSIVSHGQCQLLLPLLNDLIAVPEIGRILITLNKAEVVSFPSALDGKVIVARNVRQRGFAANHNSAFTRCDKEYFLVLNPDIRIPDSAVIKNLINSACAFPSDLIAPISVSSEGRSEGSVRAFPSLLSVLKRVIRIPERNILDGKFEPIQVPWVGGMFMLFRSTAFEAVNGFDEGFYLYYEDVDICARLWGAGLRVVACPSVRVIHDAQRTSHKSARFMFWHIKSLLRYLYKHCCRLPKIPEGDVSSTP